MAIKNLASSKASSPSEFSLEFYKLLIALVSPTLQEMYNRIRGGPYLPLDHQAHIKLTVKKGKNPTEPGSYRPISLLNIDSKILSTIVAFLLANMPSLIIQLSQVLSRDAQHPTLGKF